LSIDIDDLNEMVSILVIQSNRHLKDRRDYLHKGDLLAMSKSIFILIALVAISFSLSAAAENPTGTIANGQVKATLYLPDAQKGFYRGTRFDWSGLVSSFEYEGHNYIGTWYQSTDPQVLDFEFRGDQIVTGPCTTMVGVPEEFNTAPSKIPLGWGEAKVGGNFVKVGVGVLRKPDDKPYDHFRLYPIVDGGKWTVKRKADSIEFTQTVKDPESGYGYVYTKRVSLTAGKAQLVINHTLRNTGNKPIQGQVYNHNFMRWDNETPNPDYSISFAFAPKVKDSQNNPPLSISGKTAVFTRALADRDAMRVTPEGFGTAASDYDFHIENKKLGIGLRATADQPIAQLAIWGIRSVFAVEPFISYNIQPGAEFSWKLVYDAYTLPAAGR
jgi:hypothetical protein